MNEKSVDILPRFEPEIKPEAQFQQSQQCEPEQRQVLKNCEKFANRQTVRSLNTGKVVPCDRCAEVFLDGDYCKQCRVRRLNTGLEAIGSIIHRMGVRADGK